MRPPINRRTLALIVPLLLTPALAFAQIAHLEDNAKGGRGGRKPLPFPWLWKSAQAGSTYFGGTYWAADSMRWEAIEDSCWTFDSGVGSNYVTSAPGSPDPVPFVDPFKLTGLHATMEGWVGIDRTYSEIPYFRRLAVSDFAGAPDTCVGAAAGLGGNASFWAGVLPAEAQDLCFHGGPGYGNNWFVCICKQFTYNGTGTVTWNLDFVSDTEPGFDYTYFIADTSCNGDEVIVQSNTGSVSGNANLSLTPGVSLRSDAGCIELRICVSSNGAGSDEDGQYATSCGAIAVDDISVSGGGISDFADFESGADGWTLCDPSAGLGGDWSDLRDLSSLSPVLTSCSCAMSDTVLVFEDLSVGGHGLYQDNIAASPWIDLLAAGVSGAPGKAIRFDGYFELPLLNYIFVRVEAQWYPEACPETGKLRTSSFEDDGRIRYFGAGVPDCTIPGSPYTVDYSGVVDSGAEQMRIALGVVSFCRFAANCTGITNSTPWFDNVKLVVFGNPDVPLLRARDIDRPQDALPENGTIRIDAPGRLDAKNTGFFDGFDTGHSLGDTLVVSGAAGGAAVQVVFAVDPGPGVDFGALAAFLSNATYVQTSNIPQRAATAAGGGSPVSVDWYAVRIDTAEQGGALSVRSWMTAYHEDDPGRITASDTAADPGDLDPAGATTRLLNDIFPDDLFTPGTRVSLFFRTAFLADSPLPGDPIDDNSYFNLPAVTSDPNTTAFPIEWECLPSSMAADSTFNCVLYVDHFDGGGAQGFIEEALGSLLGTGSGNFEEVNWDRFDVRAPSSDQGSLGRPLGTEYGATLAQLLAYEAILWNSGDLGAFDLVREDADVLIPWLALENSGTGTGFNNNLYISGDGVAKSIDGESSSEPSALVLMNEFMGVSYNCNTFRTANCPVGEPNADATPCVPLDPAGGARTADNPLRSVSHLGQGNGCYAERSFDVLDQYLSGLGTPVTEELYHVGGPKNGGAGTQSVSITNVVSGIPDYKTVFDGISVHYRRDDSSPDQASPFAVCSYAAPGTAGNTPVTERLNEVLTWFGYTGGATCADRLAGVGPPPVVDHVYRTALHAVSPNPVRESGARISFTLSRAERVRVEVFDLQGRLVKTVFDDAGERGLNEVVWNRTDRSGREVGSGVYFYRLSAPEGTFTKKLVLIRQ